MNKSLTAKGVIDSIFMQLSKWEGKYYKEKN
jgi:hypothetical protein